MDQQSTWTVGGGRTIDLAEPTVMAIINATPDSFSDGGRFTDAQDAIDAALRCLDEGAALLDIGGESTRPGAQRVPGVEQIRRVLPVIEGVMRQRPDALISVDTTRAAVAEAAALAGAAIVNDVSGGLDDEDMLPVIARLGTGCILMHRERPPERDAYSDRYETPPITGDAVTRVRRALRRRLEAAEAAGVRTDAVVLDPGLGFGKTVEQNLALMRRTGELLTLGRPVLSGTSRKSFLGRIGLQRDSDPGERLGASIAASVLHASSGARLFRVHDVREHTQALRLWWALAGSEAGTSG
ncbi:MAG: dihydropteroate synthase [Phycisphaerales bacterium]